MPNYATTDVYGTDPTTGQRVLIATAGSEIPAQYDSLVAGGSKTSTPPGSSPVLDNATRTLQTTFPALGLTADGDQVLGEVPVTGRVVGASYTPEANVTGNNTETRTVTVVNKGSDGNGTTVVATLAFTTGVNASDFDEKALTLSAVAGATSVTAGDILAVASAHGGSTGLADPGGLAQVQINPA